MQISFLLPKKKKFLIYDTSYFFFQIIKNLNKNNFSFLDLRFGEKENNKLFVFVLIKIFFSINNINIFLKEGLKVAYIFSFIKLVDPKIIITFTDNDLNFYKLKKYFKNKLFVAIQNGYRHEFGDIFGNPLFQKEKGLSCDYILTYADSVNKKYKKFIKCKTISVGSLKNNSVPIANSNNSKDIIFISQVPRQVFFNKSIKHFEVYQVSISDFMRSHNKLLRCVYKYCNEKGYNLKILLRNSDIDKIEMEKKYFRKIILGNKFTFISKNKKNINISYKVIDTSLLNISSWSTLGYESLSRNKKTVFFREKTKYLRDYLFGWHFNNIPEGFFFSNKITYNDVRKIMNKVIKCSKKEWIIELNKFKKNILNYNRGNTKIKSFFEKISC